MRSLLASIYRGLFTAVERGIVLVAIIGAGMLATYILAPLSPAITLITVIVGTVIACGSGFICTALALVGLLLYALGWPTAQHYGPILGSSLCAIGVGLWFWAVIRGIAQPFTPQPQRCE